MLKPGAPFSTTVGEAGAQAPPPMQRPPPALPGIGQEAGSEMQQLGLNLHTEMGRQHRERLLQPVLPGHSSRLSSCHFTVAFCEFAEIQIN